MRRHFAIFAILVIAFDGDGADSFSPLAITTHRNSRRKARATALPMAGAGMGMGGMTAKSKKKGKKKKSKAGGGMGGSPKSSSSTPYDASASLLRNERIYDEICKEAYKELDSEYDDYDSITTEYTVTARSAAAASIADWIPVAQIVVVRPLDAGSGGSDGDSQHLESIRAAVSEFCREAYHAAVIAAPVFNTVPRNEVQYGVEPLDSFHRYVYDDVIEGKSSTGSSGAKGDAIMTKPEARTLLELDEDSTDAGEIKRAYRKRTFALHPDRFVGVDRTEAEQNQTSEEFAKVKIAYEVLSSGVRGTTENGVSSGKSWYESLGGRARMDFAGPIDLLPISKAKKTIEGLGCRTAIVGLSPDVSMAFVARNQAASVGK